MRERHRESIIAQAYPEPHGALTVVNRSPFAAVLDPAKRRALAYLVCTIVLALIAGVVGSSQKSLAYLCYIIIIFSLLFCCPKSSLSTGFVWAEGRRESA